MYQPALRDFARSAWIQNSQEWERESADRPQGLEEFSQILQVNVVGMGCDTSRRALWECLTTRYDDKATQRVRNKLHQRKTMTQKTGNTAKYNLGRDIL
jgi:hypothetical protein